MVTRKARVAVAKDDCKSLDIPDRRTRSAHRREMNRVRLMACSTHTHTQGQGIMEEVHGTKVVNCRNPSTRRRTVNGILPGTHPTQSDEGSNSYRLDGADERRLVEDERYHARPQTRHKR